MWVVMFPFDPSNPDDETLETSKLRSRVLNKSLTRNVRSEQDKAGTDWTESEHANRRKRRTNR